MQCYLDITNIIMVKYLSSRYCTRKWIENQIDSGRKPRIHRLSRNDGLSLAAQQEHHSLIALAPPELSVSDEVETPARKCKNKDTFQDPINKATLRSWQKCELNVTKLSGISLWLFAPPTSSFTACKHVSLPVQNNKTISIHCFVSLWWHNTIFSFYP